VTTVPSSTSTRASNREVMAATVSSSWASELRWKWACASASHRWPSSEFRKV
jgi:hypothetical protein